jgi:hypothetical protein
MLALALAVLFTLTIRRTHIARTTRTNRAATNRGDWIVAAISLSLWSTVGLMGRAIGFW